MHGLQCRQLCVCVLHGCAHIGGKALQCGWNAVDVRLGSLGQETIRLIIGVLQSARASVMMVADQLYNDIKNYSFIHQFNSTTNKSEITDLVVAALAAGHEVGCLCVDDPWALLRHAGVENGSAAHSGAYSSSVTAQNSGGRFVPNGLICTEMAVEVSLTNLRGRGA